MIKKFNNKKGFSLVEIILAVSIFALSVMGLTGGLIYGQQSSLLASHRAQAVLLATEGVEASQNISAESFSNLVNGSFGLVIAGNIYTLSGNSDVWDIYERQIIVSDIDANTKQVISNVSWAQSTFDEGQISFTTYVTNWK
jgi:prepilin-type N-terminal cleavage/methylation domain-containing protein